MGSHPQVPSITINDRAEIWGITMDLAINAVANSKLVCRYTQDNVFALLDGCHFAYSCDKNCTINTCADQKSVNFRIYIDIAVFASYNTHFTAFSVLHHNLLPTLNCHALIQTYKLERPLTRFDWRKHIIDPLNDYIHMNLCRVLQGTSWDLLLILLKEWCKLWEHRFLWLSALNVENYS